MGAIALLGAIIGEGFALVPAAEALALPPTDPQPSWVRTHDGSAGTADAGQMVAFSPDGNVVFVGGYEFAETIDYVVIAYSAASGEIIWKSGYDGPANDSDYLNAITVSPDGSRVYATGDSAGPGGWDVATVAFHSGTGATLWTNRFDGPVKGDDHATAIAASPDGSLVYVAGDTVAASGSADYLLVAYGAAGGRRAWSSVYDGPAGGSNAANALALSPDGRRVFLTGGSPGTDGTSDYATVAYRARSGRLVWVARFNSGQENDQDLGRSIVASPKGNQVFVTGWSYSPERYTDYVTIAYDIGSGAQSWLRSFNGPSAVADDHTAGITTSPSGDRVFVTGDSADARGRPTFATLAYAADTGQSLWLARYEEGVFAAGIQATGDGVFVVVAGTAQVFPGNGSLDLATVVYRAASGGQVQDARFDYVGNDDFANSLAVRPDGMQVALAGVTTAEGSDADIITVVYGYAALR